MANKNLFPKAVHAARKTKKTAKAKQDQSQEEVAVTQTGEATTSQPQESAAPKASGKKKIKVTKAIKEKKPSMVDAALKVLADTKEPMTCKDLVEAMTTKGLWSSPNGKTPSNTLYSAFLRLIQTKAKTAPIRRADKGTFELNPTATR